MQDHPEIIWQWEYNGIVVTEYSDGSRTEVVAVSRQSEVLANVETQTPPQPS